MNKYIYLCHLMPRSCSTATLAASSTVWTLTPPSTSMSCKISAKMDRKWMDNGYTWPTSRSFLPLTLLFLLKIIAFQYFQWYYGIHTCHAYTNTQVYVYIMLNTLKYDLEHTKRKESFEKPSSSTKWYVCSWSLWNSICSMLQLIFSYMRLNMIKICDTMFHVASYSSQYVRSPTLGLSKPSKICWFQMVLITKGPVCTPQPSYLHREVMGKGQQIGRVSTTGHFLLFKNNERSHA